MNQSSQRSGSIGSQSRSEHVRPHRGLVALGTVSADDFEWLHAYEGFHRPVLGTPSSLAAGDSRHDIIHYSLRYQVKIHPSQMEDERRLAGQSYLNLGGHHDFPAHPLPSFLLPDGLIIPSHAAGGHPIAGVPSLMCIGIEVFRYVATILLRMSASHFLAPKES
jgi:hypothetical protein